MQFFTSVIKSGFFDWQNLPDGYRYGFNGMEKDDEVKGSGNSYDFGARIYDPRVGRWLSRDPLERKYPYHSPYIYVANNPIFYVDIDGREFKPSTIEKVSYSEPMTAHDLGNTRLTKVELVYNMQTKSWDLLAEVTVTMNYALLNEGTEINSPGLKEEVCNHEQGHVNQNFEAVESPVDVSIVINGNTLLFSGRADDVMNQVDAGINKNMQMEYDQAVKSGIIKTQADADKFTADLSVKYAPIRQGAYDQAIAGVSANQTTQMDTSTPTKKTAIENDANDRVAEEAPLKYAGGPLLKIIVDLRGNRGTKELKFK